MYLQNSRAQLTGEDSLAAPNSSITYTILLHWTKSNNRNRQERLLFCRFQIYKKNICQNKCIHVWIRAIRDKKCIGYSGNLPHCPAKRKTAAKSIATTTVKSTFHLQLYGKKWYVLLTAFVYTALWRRKPSAISATKQWEWIRKATRATFSHKDIKI